MTRRNPPVRIRARESRCPVRALGDVMPRGSAAEGRSILLIVTRVGEAKGSLVGFAPSSDCYECRRPVWVRASVARLAERRGLAVIAVCTTCLSEGGRA